MTASIIQALEAKYQAEIAEAEANVGVYMNNPVGIGEHPDLVSAVDSQIARIAEADDKLKVLKEYYL